jgi:excisionase family DNA binding protein
MDLDLQPEAVADVVQIHGEDYLNAGEAAAMLGIKPATLYAYVSRGVLRSYRQGIKRRRLYRERDVRGILRLHPSGRHAPLPPAADWMGDP